MNKELLKKLSIEDYYLKMVYSRGGKYAKGHPVSDRLVLCPLHDDKNPSMGFIHGKDGVTKFHCFGCGRAGTVLDLHMGINKLRDEEQALKEVCSILEIPYEELHEDSINEDFFSARLRKIRSFNTQLTDAKVADSLRGILKESNSTDYINRFFLNVLWLKGEE